MLEELPDETIYYQLLPPVDRNHYPFLIIDTINSK